MSNYSVVLGDKRFNTVEARISDLPTGALWVDGNRNIHIVGIYVKPISAVVDHIFYRGEALKPNKDYYSPAWTYPAMTPASSAIVRADHVVELLVDVDWKIHLGKCPANDTDPSYSKKYLKDFNVGELYIIMQISKSTGKWYPMICIKTTMDEDALVWIRPSVDVLSYDGNDYLTKTWRDPNCCGCKEHEYIEGVLELYQEEK